MTPPLLNAGKHSDAELTHELTQMLTRWGFTTVFDIASLLTNTNVIRRRVAAGTVIGPTILTVGDPFYPKGGTPIYVRQFMKDNGFPDEEIGNLPDAVARAHRQIHEGADGVKLFAGAIVGGEVGVLPMPLERGSGRGRACRGQTRVCASVQSCRADCIDGQRRGRPRAHHADDGPVARGPDRPNFGSPHGADPDS